MKMKKLFSTALATVILFGLCACDSSSNSNKQEQSQTSLPQNDTQVEQPVEKETTKNENKSTNKESVSIEETVLVDDKGIKITAREIDTADMFDTGIKLLIENNSDTNVTVQTRNASINGYMIESSISSSVAAGKKANDTITFTNSDLKACGIETIADFEFAFHIFTTDDWETYLDTEPIQIKTSAAETYTYTYTYDDSGDVIYEGNGVKIVSKGISNNDSFSGPELILFIENNNDKTISIQARDVSINGFMVEHSFSENVATNKRAVGSLSFMNSNLKENGITDITDMELSFRIYDSNSWDTIVDTEKISLTF